jgi:UDP-N-acetylmuramate dehydrogenase
LRVEDNISLASLTTLGVGGVAKKFARLDRAEDLPDALALDPNILVLGGGSNLIVRDGGWDGLVLQIAIPGVFAVDDVVTANAGVVWDDFVQQMIDEGRAGLECMSGIPGLVGATPMQNVGAYGQEVSDTVVAVQVFDRHTGRFDTMLPAQCEFAYRHSVFRGSDRWIIVEVAFKLPRRADSAPIKYPELCRALGIEVGGTAPLAHVRQTVIALRKVKGMVVDAEDPESRSAGSFFTNPIVDAELAAKLALEYPNMPLWPAGERTKLSAGWLIERAGFPKGTTRGNVRISNKHALALVNGGGATTAELLALAAEIQDGVRAKMGVELQREPILVGVESLRS